MEKEYVPSWASGAPPPAWASSANASAPPANAPAPPANAPAPPANAPAPPATSSSQETVKPDLEAQRIAQGQLETLYGEVPKVQQTLTEALRSGNAETIARAKGDAESLSREIVLSKGIAPQFDYALRAAPGSGNTVGESIPKEGMAQRVAYGTMGATAGAALAAIPVAKMRAAIAGTKVLKKLSANNPATAPDLSPTTGGNSSDQNSRILRGGEGGTEGTTGRQRQTGYGVETAQNAAAKALAEDVAALMKKYGITESDAREYLAKQAGLTSTPHGVLTFRSDPAQTLGPRVYNETGGYTIGGTRTPAPTPTMYESAMAAVKRLAGSVPDSVKNFGSTIEGGLRHPMGLAAGMGFGIGASVPEILENIRKNQYGEAAKSAGKGAALGLAPSVLPAVARAGLRVVAPVAGAAVNEYDAFKRAQEGDYTGSTIAGVGGLGALAPFVISGPVGWGVGATGALAPPIINYLRDRSAQEEYAKKIAGRGFENPFLVEPPPVPQNRDPKRFSP